MSHDASPLGVLASGGLATLATPLAAEGGGALRWAAFALLAAALGVLGRLLAVVGENLMARVRADTRRIDRDAGAAPRVPKLSAPPALTTQERDAELLNPPDIREQR